MTTECTAAPAAPPPDQPEEPEDRRSRLLWKLFDLLLAALVRALDKPDVTAATMDIARKLLGDNNIKADGRSSLGDGLARLGAGLSKLPFDA